MSKLPNTQTGLRMLDPSKIEVCHIHRRKVLLDAPSAPQVDLEANEVKWDAHLKFQEDGKVLKIQGFMVVENTGAYSSRICNAVINLQRKTAGGKWTTIRLGSLNPLTASAIANLAQGEMAASANIVPGASSDGTIATYRCDFSIVKGLKFFDMDNHNTITAFKNPELHSLGPAEIKGLVFEALFDSEAISAVVGENLRVECLVTFDNAGARGGSGASAANIDVDGDGAPEAFSRTIKYRKDFQVGAAEECNTSATLTFSAASVENCTVEVKNYKEPQVATADASYQVVVGMEPADSSKESRATLRIDMLSAGQAEPHVMTWVSTTYPMMPPASYSYKCCEDQRDYKEAAVVMAAEQIVWSEKDKMNTKPVGQWLSQALPAEDFNAVYPAPDRFKITDPSNAKNYVQYTSFGSMLSLLNSTNPSNKMLGSRTGAILNSSNTTAGNYLRQLISLKLNIDLSDQNRVPFDDDLASLGDLAFCAPSWTVGDMVIDLTKYARVRDVVKVMVEDLFTSKNASAVKYLEALAILLNNAFVNNIPSAFALACLERP